MSRRFLQFFAKSEEQRHGIGRQVFLHVAQKRVEIKRVGIAFDRHRARFAIAFRHRHTVHGKITFDIAVLLNHWCNFACRAVLAYIRYVLFYSFRLKQLKIESNCIWFTFPTKCVAQTINKKEKMFFVSFQQIATAKKRISWRQHITRHLTNNRILFNVLKIKHCKKKKKK